MIVKTIAVLMNDVCEMHLNMDKILKLSDVDKKIVLDLYDKLIKSFYSSGTFTLPGGIQFDVIGANTIYNTLTEGGYLVTRRERNIDSVLENNK